VTASTWEYHEKSASRWSPNSLNELTRSIWSSAHCMKGKLEDSATGPMTISFVLVKLTAMSLILDPFSNCWQELPNDIGSAQWRTGYQNWQHWWKLTSSCLWPLWLWPLRALFKYVLVLSVLCHSLSADSLRAYCSAFYSQTAWLVASRAGERSGTQSGADLMSTWAERSGERWFQKSVERGAGVLSGNGAGSGLKQRSNVAQVKKHNISVIS